MRGAINYTIGVEIASGSSLTHRFDACVGRISTSVPIARMTELSRRSNPCPFCPSAPSWSRAK